MGNPLVRFCEGQEFNCEYGRDIVAPPRKAGGNREDKHCPVRSQKSPVYSKGSLSS